MPQRESRAFKPRAACAIFRPSFGCFYDFWGPPPEPFEVVGDAAIVTISGPLMHHEDFWCDSYDSIAGRVDAALKSDAARLILKIDSPGGVVSGCLELSRSIRAKAADAGKRVVTFAPGPHLCSGGYALACAGDEIYAEPSVTIGSVGVLVGVLDVTKQDAMFGEQWTFITSGEAKADGNPHQALTTEATARMQSEVDELSQMFFELVNEARHLPIDTIRGFSAGVMFGAKAKAAGLIDRVATLDDVLAMTAGIKETTMAWKDDMRKAAKEGDEEAVKALSALDEESDEEKEKKRKEDEKAAKEAEEAAAATDADPAEDSASKASRAKLPMATRMALLEADSEKRNLIMSRPDLPAAKRAELMAQPLSVVRFAVKELPKVVKSPAAPAAAPGVTPPATPPRAHAGALTPPGVTPGADSIADPRNPPVATSEDAALEAAIDKAMGVNRVKVVGVVQKGNVIQFGHMTAAQAAKRLAELEAEEATEAQKGAAS